MSKKLEELDKKLEELQQKRKALLAAEKEKARKLEISLKISLGEIAKNYGLNTPEKLKLLLDELVQEGKISKQEPKEKKLK